MVSSGCEHCYAETWGKRFGVQWGSLGTRIRTTKAYWRKPYAWNKQAQKDGTRPKVFCASLADVFEDKQNQPEMDIWRAELFAMIIDTPNLDWLLLTKRPENVNRMIKSAGEWWFQNGAPTTYAKKLLAWMNHGEAFALPNVWIGTSIESQAKADQRIPKLLNIPARMRFLSMEPLLTGVDLGLTMLDYPDYSDQDPGKPIEYPSKVGQMIHLVIVGGESGEGARPMNPAWARSIRDQCVSAGVPFFFKQWGEWVSYDNLASELEDRIGLAGDIPRMVKLGDTPMYRFGKHSTGDLLDGKEWKQFPK